MAARPKNAIVILMDSLNRHFLSAYGAKLVKTPNIDRLAARGVVFDRHYIGSMPCMPARHDLWTGNVEFLWRPWGPVEPGERTLPKSLKGKAVRQLVTDHYHYFESGGENYHVDFDGFEFIRGHENDPWITKPNHVKFKYGDYPRYARNMSRMVEEEHFTSPKTFQATADWLHDNHDAHDRFYLFVDEFDPHEPFHSSGNYSREYDPDWKEPYFFWPRYGPADHYPKRDLEHLRAQYAAKLAMADAWFGQVLDRLDRYKLWDSTLVMLTTDHGHFLGEHNWVGKGTFPSYEPIAHIPLIAACPGVSPGRSQALSTHVDVAATLFDLYGVDPGPIDGRSLFPVLTGEKNQIREHVLFGWFGSYGQVTDGRYTYIRAPATPDNGPLACYRSTWTTAPWWSLPVPDERMTLGRFNPREARALGRIELNEREKEALGVGPKAFTRPTQLFDLETDPNQERDLSGDAALHAKYEKLLADAMHQVGCPPEQFIRLGLKA